MTNGDREDGIAALIMGVVAALGFGLMDFHLQHSWVSAIGMFLVGWVFTTVFLVRMVR